MVRYLIERKQKNYNNKIYFAYWKLKVDFFKLEQSKLKKLRNPYLVNYSIKFNILNIHFPFLKSKFFVDPQILEIQKKNEQYFSYNYDVDKKVCEKLYKLFKSNFKSQTLDFLTILTHWIENEMTVFHKNNFIDSEIFLLKVLIKLASIIKPKLILLLYSVFSFSFTYNLDFCQNKRGRLFRFPELDLFHVHVYFFKIENTKWSYLYNVNDLFVSEYGKCDIKFLSFEEIFNNDLYFSSEFIDFLEIDLLSPLMFMKKKKIFYDQCLDDPSVIQPPSLYNDRLYKHPYFMELYKISKSYYFK